MKDGLEKARSLLKELFVSIDIEGLKREIEGLTVQTMDENFWNDQDHARKIYDQLNEMKKKVAVSLTSLSLAAGMGGQALAVEWHPSRTQSEVGVVERVAAGAASAIAVTQATGAAAAGQLADSTDPIIQVTPVSVTLAANAAVDAANPGSAGADLAGRPTGSGLSYAANGQLNNLYNQVTAAKSTEQLLADTAPAAAAGWEKYEQIRTSCHHGNVRGLPPRLRARIYPRHGLLHPVGRRGAEDQHPGRRHMGSAGSHPGRRPPGLYSQPVLLHNRSFHAASVQLLGRLHRHLPPCGGPRPAPAGRTAQGRRHQRGPRPCAGQGLEAELPGLFLHGYGAGSRAALSHFPL